MKGSPWGFEIIYSYLRVIRWSPSLKGTKHGDENVDPTPAKTLNLTAESIVQLPIMRAGKISPVSRGRHLQQYIYLDDKSPAHLTFTEASETLLLGTS
jgi:hypothetical protein